MRIFRRSAVLLLAAGVAAAVTAAPATACGGLVAPNGAVRLLRTSTLAAYHDGVEHYVTSFTFAGDDSRAPNGESGEFGSIVPLPGVPTSVERGGDWTLQRLAREVTPVAAATAATFKKSSAISDSAAQVLLQTRIDALDLTVLKGGGTAVGNWAREHGFLLTPDAPEVLDFYARRSPIFLAARFDAAAARSRGQRSGDGTPIHLTIPVENPWVPLRILALGRGALEPINADVFLLTDEKPALLGDSAGVDLERSSPAGDGLLRDLRSDKGMAWMPEQMWFSYLRISTPAGRLDHDLAIDTSARRHPSLELAGFSVPSAAPAKTGVTRNTGWAVAAALGAAIAVIGAFIATRSLRPTA